MFVTFINEAWAPCLQGDSQTAIPITSISYKWNESKYKNVYGRLFFFFFFFTDLRY